MWRRVGLVGVALAMLGGSGLVALSVPWLGTADEPHHLDYAGKVYQRTLPSWDEGPEIDVGRSLPSAQLAANHPPLYYAVLAPVVGPPLQEGRWVLATFLGRIVTIGLGVLMVFAASWAAFQVTGSQFHSVSIPALLASFFPVSFFAGFVHNDILLVLLTSLGLGITARMIRGDSSWAVVMAAAIVGALGMATRVSFLGVLFAMLIGVGLNALVNRDGGPLLARLRWATGRLAVAALFIGAAIGWFYWRNYQLSGDFFRAVPQERAGNLFGRNYRSATEVLALRDFRLLLPTSLYGREWPSGWGGGSRWLGMSPNQIISAAVLTSAGILAGLRAVQCRKKLRGGSLVVSATALVVGVQVPLALAQQWVHATGYGALNARYLLPAFFSIAVLVSVGAGALGRARVFFVVPVVITGWAMLVSYTAALLSTRWGLEVSLGRALSLPSGMMAANGFSGALGTSALLILLAGLTCQCVALWQLRGSGDWRHPFQARAAGDPLTHWSHGRSGTGART